MLLKHPTVFRTVPTTEEKVCGPQTSVVPNLSSPPSSLHPSLGGFCLLYLNHARLTGTWHSIRASLSSLLHGLPLSFLCTREFCMNSLCHSRSKRHRRVHITCSVGGWLSPSGAGNLMSGNLVSLSLCVCMCMRVHTQLREEKAWWSNMWGRNKTALSAVSPEEWAPQRLGRRGAEGETGAPEALVGKKGGLKQEEEAVWNCGS